MPNVQVTVRFGGQAGADVVKAPILQVGADGFVNESWQAAGFVGFHGAVLFAYNLNQKKLL